MYLSLSSLILFTLSALSLLCRASISLSSITSVRTLSAILSYCPPMEFNSHFTPCFMDGSERFWVALFRATHFTCKYMYNNNMCNNIIHVTRVLGSTHPMCIANSTTQSLRHLARSLHLADVCVWITTDGQTDHFAPCACTQGNYSSPAWPPYHTGVHSVVSQHSI